MLAWRQHQSWVATTTSLSFNTDLSVYMRMRLCDRISSESMAGIGLKWGLFENMWSDLMLDLVGFHSNRWKYLLNGTWIKNQVFLTTSYR